MSNQCFDFKTLEVFFKKVSLNESKRWFQVEKMPPKKKVEEEKPIIVGRLGTNLRCGIVGLPNVGKSTFFNVLTKTQIAAAENFPFCTIDPNENK